MSSTITSNSSDIARGIEKYRNELNKLPNYLHRRHMKAAFGRSLKAFLGDFKAAVPKDSGILRRGINVRTGAEPWASGGQVWARLSYRVDGEKGKAGLWIERGTKARRTQKDANRGKVLPFHILQRRGTELYPRIIARISFEMYQAVDAALNELPVYLTKQRW